MSHQISRGLVSIINSTITSLSAGETFTGEAEDVSQYRSLSVFVDTDQNGQMFIEISIDGVNWDRRKTVKIDQQITSGTLKNYPVFSQFFRVVFVNGPVQQGHIRLQSIFHTSSPAILTSGPDQIISPMFEAQLTRSCNDVMLDISRGLFTDKFTVSVSASNTAVTSGTFSEIWSYGPTQAKVARPLTVEKFRVASGGSPDDTDSGSGAWEVEILYLDGSGDLESDTLTLDGASASNLTSTAGRRVIFGQVTKVGTDLGSNLGDIIIENVDSNDIVAVISTGDGQTQMSQTTVPTGFSGYIRSIHVNVSVGNNKDSDVRFCARNNAFATSAPFGATQIVKKMEWSSKS